MSATPWRRHALAPWLAVAAGWLVSRLVFRAVLGIDFDASSLDWFWQYIDPPLLRSDPWTSVFYHHAQPPLFNLYLAAALWLGGDDPTRLLSAGHMAAGLALHLALYALLHRLGVRTGLAVGACILFAFSPGSILYESWLFYTYPLAAVLVGAAWALHRLIDRGARTPDALLFFSLLAVAVLTRSLFHLAWMLAVIGAVLYAMRPHARRLLIAAALPTLLCVGVYAKNAALIGSFSSSSWLGMNLARLVIDPIPAPERLEMYRQGRITAVSLVTPFSSLDRYPAALRRVPSPDHPVLRAHAKRSGVVNYNHIAYVEISRRYQRDALSLIAESPARYLSSVGRAWLLFTWAPSEYWNLDRGRARMEGWNRLFNAIVYGVPAAFVGPGEPPDRLDGRSLLHHAGLLFTVATVVALVLGFVVAIRDLRSRGPDTARSLTLLFMVGTFLWVAFVGNALEMRENNRFRFMVEPLIIALMVFGADYMLSRKARRAGLD